VGRERSTKKTFMPKPRKYPLNDYIKAAEILGSRRNLIVKSMNATRGSAVRFEVYDQNGVLMDFWTVHTEHDRRRFIWSKEDYRKPDKHLFARPGEFMEILEDL